MVITPIVAPVRVSTAFSPTVQPCSTSEICSTGMPSASIPARNPSDWSCGVVGTLQVVTAPVSSSTATQSVNVPPMSMPTRNKRTTSTW